MTERYILVIDEGTTSTRSMLYASDGSVRSVAQAAIEQHYPRPGWVEHDAEEIFSKTLACMRQMVNSAGGADRIAAIGVTNQRETVVAWDCRTGRAISPAIVWQDRRTADFCDALKQSGHEVDVQSKSGLLLDPYFSGTKMRWILDNVPQARELGDNLAFGTMESWLVWKLTGGLHISDATNACRTALMALDGCDWDAGLCDLFGIPATALPTIVGCAEIVGTTLPDMLGAAIPIAGMAGDQQAATIGQGCLAPGHTKATFGTGAFILTSTGSSLPHSSHRLLGTVLADVGGERTYALEGSVFVAGSLIKWLRDNLGVIQSANDSERLARSVANNGGVVILPALSGLGAPHWRPNATAVISGLTHNSTAAHIVRAALESMAHQCHDLKRAFAADGAEWQTMCIDGGMSANDWLAQDLADVLDVSLERPVDIETTARGAAMLASVGAGIHANLQEARTMLPPSDRFEPAMNTTMREARLAAWRKVLTQE